MFKDILLSALLGKIDESATRQACMLAQRWSGSVTALVAASYFVPATAAWAYYREGTAPGAFANLEAAGAAVLQGYVNAVEKRLKTEDVPHVVKGVAEFWLTPAEISVRHAVAADVIVLGVGRPLEAEQEKLFAGALSGSGRPVLIVPSTSSARAFDHVLIAWKDSREAARAVRDALPILKKAKTVEVVLVERHGDGGSSDSGAQLIEHLRMHDVDARLVRLPRTETATGWTIVDHAVGSGADLIVAGGYGHARAMENVFGGVTAYLLQFSPLAVLFSH